MHHAIQQFIQSRFRASIGRTAIDHDTPLFSSGLVDSFGVLEVIAFVEDTFAVTIDPARHELADLDTVGKIATLVTRLRQGRPG
jgi:acyl carrier protein